jgi:hexosaminidase
MEVTGTRSRSTLCSGWHAGLLVLVAACRSGAPGSAGPSGTGGSGGAPGASDARSGRPDTAPAATGVDASVPAPVDAEGSPPGGTADGSAAPVQTLPLKSVVPLPGSASEQPGVFRLSPGTAIRVAPATPEMLALGRHLADRLTATGYALPVSGAAGSSGTGNVLLTTQGADASLGEEGYQLAIAAEGVTLAAAQPAGIFRGLQTIRQLLGDGIEQPTVQPGPWGLATGTIRDQPRFAWRGAMLDVARHFFGVEIVRRFIDLLAYYKMNRLHLHLSDDQGWRIAIEGWPNLAAHGGSTQVGGGPGGHFTRAQYAEIVAYAQERYITVVPEIDMPGHTNAALASYPELNCNGMSPPLYTGVDVGFSSLCIGRPATDRFVAEVLAELAAMTPGPWLHVGGDEALSTVPAEYVAFISSAQKVVRALGKQMIGWEEVAAIDDLDRASLVQHWSAVALASRAKQQGARIIMSPASRAYLDMKYDAATVLGGTWAGFIDEQRAYEWDPATQVPGITEADIVGIEAPLWSETIRTGPEVELLAMPRLAGYAEIGWSPAQGRSWAEYRSRIGAHGPRLRAMGVNFHQSSRIPWR